MKYNAVYLSLLFLLLFFVIINKLQLRKMGGGGQVTVVYDTHM